MRVSRSRLLLGEKAVCCGGLGSLDGDLLKGDQGGCIIKKRTREDRHEAAATA